MNKIKQDYNEKIFLKDEAELYSKGYAIGFARGCSKGYNKKYAESYAEGYAEGYVEELLIISKAFGMTLAELEEIIQKTQLVPIK